MIARGLTGSFLVLLGGLLVSPLPDTARLLYLDVVVELREHMLGRMAGLTLVMTGLGLLAAAWLSLCRYVARAEGVEREGALGLVRYATLMWSTPLMVAPPLFSRDGWSYAAQGMLTALDISPYANGPSLLRGPIVNAVDPRWMDTPTPYGPLPLILGDLAARFTGNPWILVVAHRGIAVVGLVLLAWAVPRLASWCGANPALASVFVLASPLMLANGVGGLHNDLLMVGLMAAALVVAVERGWQWGAMLGGLAAAVKLPGGLICVAVVLVSLPVAASMGARLRRFAGVGALSLAVLFGLGAVWGLGAGWVDSLSVPGTVNTPLSAPTVLGGALDWSAQHLGLGSEPAWFLDRVRHLATALSLVVVVALALRAPTGHRKGAVHTTVVLVAATIVLSPVVHLWYFLWLVPFLACLRLSRLAGSALVAVSVVLGLVAPLDSSLHGAYLAIVMGCSYVALLVPLLLLTRRARERLEKIADAEWLPVP
ncbi:polyprenol phosphomannose-dependent alpha 1,6 mannosyltransferase MptB [Nocardioides jensenii]|uniref:polyprenol phosphomannose-dependent alpha 1,6 mannosyltransferase MptB n=1 Tax=Nocardioides jensenii TaxID=1843 RepID=UPI0008297C44|nr:polyprenol phosphomannose-dependent alpha 1,6 mannosyltransferase MptB [Nocardioides jensenii]